MGHTESVRIARTLQKYSLAASKWPLCASSLNVVLQETQEKDGMGGLSLFEIRLIIDSAGGQ